VLLIMVAVLLAVGAFFGVGSARQYLADRSFKPIKPPAATAAPANVAAALTALAAAPSESPAATQAAAPSAEGVSAALVPKLQVDALGSQVAAQVIDAGTGTVLLDQRSAELVAPASTAKLLVAAAILTVHKATDQFITKVVAGTAPGSVVLVGGGDPTLSGAAAGQPTAYAEAARISDLAAQVRKAMAGAPVTEIVVDNSVFAGPTTAAGWGSADAPSTYASPITGTMVDGGRNTPDPNPDALRSGAPDVAAGQALAAALGGASVTHGAAPAGAKVLGQVQSASVSRLVEQMLTESDNVIAEVLTRQVALAAKRPGSFAAGAAAVSAALVPLGIKVGAGMKDGSGLSVQDMVPAAVLAQILKLALDSKHPELHPIVSGLPVAGWSGTLAERFTGSSMNGKGAVRAKTGTLDGVSAEAGIVTDADGRVLVFALVADKVPATDPARAALDAVAATLASCGCR
jgi:D-alanyl-D-alanine carboxypeptidase/D-alanyl-D-alanine-endopeptidase (penicillin-binding protein 4)